MKKHIVFVLSLILGSIVCLPAEAVVLTPSNIVIPELPGETFSFDLIIDDPMGVTAASYHSAMFVSDRGGLTFNTTASQAVVTTDADYWVFGNSSGVFTSTFRSIRFKFADSPSNPEIETLLAGDVMARYAFTWDGTAPGDYTFNFNFDITKSFIETDTGAIEALEFTSGQYRGDDSSFTVHIPEHIPEPTSILLFVLGGALLRKPKA